MPYFVETIQNDTHPSEFGFFAPFFQNFQTFHFVGIAFGSELAPNHRGWGSKNGQSETKAIIPKKAQNPIR
jgi:hypothetical protein